MASSSYIYEGAWINWDRNSVFGATITLTSTRATILVALIALFLKVTGDRCWAIIRFALHQLSITQEAPDGLGAQQRVILKNTGSDIATMWKFLQLTYFWRSRAPLVLPRC